MPLRIPRPPYDASTHEFCTKCRQVKPHDEFPLNKNMPYRGSLHSWCKVCNNKASGASIRGENGPYARRKRLDQAAMYSRRKAITTGKRPANYWDDKPLLSKRPDEYAERLRALGVSELDVQRALARLSR